MTEKQRGTLAEWLEMSEDSLTCDMKSATQSLIDLAAARATARRWGADDYARDLAEAIHLVKNLVDFAASSAAKLQEIRYLLRSEAPGPKADADTDPQAAESEALPF